MPSRLARSLHLSIRGNDLKIESPVLVPSFSSKAFVDVKSIFSVLQPFITESFLVSAYDIEHTMAFDFLRARQPKFCFWTVGAMKYPATTIQ